MSRTTEIMGKGRFEPKVWASTPAQSLVILEADEMARLAGGETVAVNLDLLGIPGGGILEICHTTNVATLSRLVKK